MNYLPTVGSTISGFFGVGLLLLGFASLFLAIATLVTLGLYYYDAATLGTPKYKLRRKDKIVWGIMLAASVVLISFTTTGVNAYKAGLDQANTNLAQNLKQKYDIKDVDFDQKDYESVGKFQAVFAPNGDAQKVIIVTNDNRKAMFVLNQDKVTSEPTLSEIPIITPVSLSSITRR